MSEGRNRRLVDTEAAEHWTGRPREVLYRWAREGRITRYGKRAPMAARWDLNELPPYRHLCVPACLSGAGCPPLPEPPPLRLPRPRESLDLGNDQMHY